MTRTIECKAQVKHWDEKRTHDGPDGTGMAVVRFQHHYSGAMEGLGQVEMHMVYCANKTARYAGFERFEGKVDGHEGSFVMQLDGVFDGVARARSRVVPHTA